MGSTEELATECEQRITRILGKMQNPKSGTIVSGFLKQGCSSAHSVVSDQRDKLLGLDLCSPDTLHPNTLNSH